MTDGTVTLAGGNRRQTPHGLTALLGQSALYFIANVVSAGFGLLNVILFTRFFAPSDFGAYVVGLGFATLLNTVLTSWLRLSVIQQQARGDGTDIRGLVLLGLLFSSLLAPLAYPAARFAGLEPAAALVSVCLAVTIGIFETGLEVLRARLQVFTITQATIVRAGLVSVLGVAATLVGHQGALLLASSALAYLLSAIVFAWIVWKGSVTRFDGARLLALAKAGVPLTLSFSLLALSGVIDKFLVSRLAGPAYAGQYGAGVDLVRQTLLIPAISVASAFIPIAVQILANQGAAAARRHLEDYVELLFALTLPACLGFALISHSVADLVLGAAFKDMAQTVMPIVSIGVIFQILTYQYLQVGFLLSGRNAFYLLNTGSVVVFNAVVSYVLIARFGVVGAAWSRLAAEALGFFSALILLRWAFPIPLPPRRLGLVLVAAIGMAVVVHSLDVAIGSSNRFELVIIIPAGIATYAVMCWLMNVARIRDRLARGLRGLRAAWAS